MAAKAKELEIFTQDGICIDVQATKKANTEDIVESIFQQEEFLPGHAASAYTLAERRNGIYVRLLVPEEWPAATMKNKDKKDKDTEIELVLVRKDINFETANERKREQPQAILTENSRSVRAAKNRRDLTIMLEDGSPLEISVSATAVVSDVVDQLFLQEEFLPGIQASDYTLAERFTSTVTRKLQATDVPPPTKSSTELVLVEKTMDVDEINARFRRKTARDGSPLAILRRPSVLPSEKDMAGWLVKRGDKVQTWKKRWCIIAGDKFAYFEPGGSDEKGKVSFSGATVTPCNSVGRPFTFMVSNTEAKRDFYLQASNAEDMRQWMMACLRAAWMRHPDEVALIEEANFLRKQLNCFDSAAAAAWNPSDRTKPEEREAQYRAQLETLEKRAADSEARVAQLETSNAERRATVESLRTEIDALARELENQYAKNKR